jgi:glucokinase
VILAGDIGGTNSRLALFERDARVPKHFEVFPSGDFSSLEPILERFLGPAPPKLAAASFGIAGPVRLGRANATNLGWAVESTSLARALRLSSVGLLNDLEATVWGIGWLRPNELVALNDVPADAAGNVAVIAAGTGLGQAGLIRTVEESMPFATESGHAGFAPETADQSRLLDFLRDTSDSHVSVENVCSGTGLVSIYRWCLAEGGQAEPEWLCEDPEHGDAAAAVAQAAQAGTDQLAKRALSIFIEIYGAEAGNLALRLLATGGVYVAGGIAVKHVNQLTAGGFMDAFVAKPPLSELLRRIPVHVVTNDQTALLGAARHAVSTQNGPAT